MIQRDYVKFSLQSKLRAYIYDMMHQRNVYHSNISVPLSRHIHVLHHVVDELNTYISWSAKKLNTLSTNHIRSICYSSTNGLMSWLIKWHSWSPSMQIYLSAATRLKTLFSLVVCNSTPYDVILFFMYSCWNS
jgi:hypothetical protein